MERTRRATVPRLHQNAIYGTEITSPNMNVLKATPLPGAAAYDRRNPLFPRWSTPGRLTDV